MDDRKHDTNTQTSEQTSDSPSYPLHHVVGALDVSRVDRAVSDLQDAGFPSDLIQVVTAQDAADFENPMDQTGVKGLLNRLTLGYGEDLSLIDRFQVELKNGRNLVMVKVDGDEEKARAIAILRQHDATSSSYFGRWTIEGPT